MKDILQWAVILSAPLLIAAYGLYRGCKDEEKERAARAAKQNRGPASRPPAHRHA